MKTIRFITVLVLMTIFAGCSTVGTRDLIGQQELEPGTSIEVVCLPCSEQCVTPTSEATPMPTPMPTPTVEPGRPIILENELHYELESAVIEGGLVRSDSQASGKQYVVLYDDDDDGDHELVRFTVDVQERRTFTVWLRARARQYSKVDIVLGDTIRRITVSSKDNGRWSWYWNNAGTFDLDSGLHQVVIRRQTRYPQIDALFIASDNSTPENELVWPVIGALPFERNRTMADMIGQSVGKDYWLQGDRDEYLVWMQELGGAQRDFSYAPRVYLRGWLPDIEGIDAFRQDNEGKTTLILYNNLYSVHRDTGEDMMGDISDYPDWFLYDSDGNRVENPRNGRDNFDFRNEDFLRYFVGRAKLYADLGADGLILDSFAVLRKHGFENGYWHDGQIEIVNPRTGETYTAEDWISDLRFSVEYIRAELDKEYGQGSVLLYVNGYGYPQLEEYGDLIDGFLNEGFAMARDGNDWAFWWFLRGEWEVDVNNLWMTEAAEKYSSLIVDYVPGDPFDMSHNDMALYSAATILAGIRGPDTMTHFRFRKGSSIIGWPGWRNIHLDDFVPMDRYERLGDGFFMRRFEDSLIYVNIGSIDRGIRLPEPYYTLGTIGEWSANPVEYITLGPGQAAVLTQRVP